MANLVGNSADPAVAAAAAVHGAAGDGVYGLGNRGVVGDSVAGVGVFGHSVDGIGLWADSTASEGVHAETTSPVTAAVAAYNLNASGTGAALFARKAGTAGHAGFFDGQVHVAGELTVTGALNLAGADYAEALTAAPGSAVTEGMVVVIDDEGQVRPCVEEYDPRAAGVVSGADDVPAAVVLDRHDGGVPVAMMGKLWVLADATRAPIRCGDMLTTSTTAGHARRVVDRSRAFGAVIGKALTPLDAGTGLVRVLVGPA